MHKSLEDRLTVSGLVTACLLLSIFSVPWIHAAVESLLDCLPCVHGTVEAVLNVSWVLLAVVAFARWNSGGSYRRDSFSGTLSLIFVLALLFPVISASDDQAQMALIDNADAAQSIALNLENHKQQLHIVASLTPAVPVAAESPACPLPFELVSEPVFTATFDTTDNTTGNHSPPLC